MRMLDARFGLDAGEPSEHSYHQQPVPNIKGVAKPHIGDAAVDTNF